MRQTHTHMNMNAVVPLAQAEVWLSWVSSWGELTEKSQVT